MSKDTLKEYMDMTGQTFQQIFAGAMSFGMEFITHELIPEALKLKKKIKWKTDITPGSYDAMSYTFEDL